MAIEKFKNRSIISFTTLFKSSPSAKDNFGDQITLSDRSLLLIFKLAGSYLGVFSSQFNNENES